MSAHRVSVLSSALRRARQQDPEHSSDPRIRELVDALRSADYAPAPSQHFRDELRAQLVAVAPRIISESAAEADSAADPATVRTAAARAGDALSARRRRFARPIAVAAGVAAAFLLLLGGAVWQSHKALPGDSLYGLKRASENVQLALSSGGTDRGHDYLRLAQRRVQESRALLHRDSASAAGRGALAGGLSAQSATFISDNLGSADSDLRHAADLLNTQAVTARSQSPISLMIDWAPGQLARLNDLAAALPAGSLQERTRSSAELTQAALSRAHALAPAVAHRCASTSKTDELGPVPSCDTTSGATSTPSAPTSGLPTSSDPASGVPASGGPTGGANLPSIGEGSTVQRPGSPQSAVNPTTPIDTAPAKPVLPTRVRGGSVLPLPSVSVSIAPLPRISTPNVSLPGISLPGVSVPGVSVPSVSLPGLPLP